MAHQDWSIAVGISQYPSLGDLRAPENDAKAIHAWLRDGRGGAVPKNQARLIISSDFGPPFTSPDAARPALEELSTALRNLEAIARRNSDAGEGFRVGRRLWLYFAGHGFSPTLHETALVLANALREDPVAHVLGPDTAHYFSLRCLFDEVILFMDCCREAAPVTSLTRVFPKAGPGPCEPKFMHALATKYSKLARERQFGNDGPWHGSFTKALLDGLRTADSGKGQITSGSLTSFLYERLKEYLLPEDLQNPTIPNEPQIDYEPKGPNQIVLAPRWRSHLEWWYDSALDRPAQPHLERTLVLSSPFLGSRATISDGQLQPLTVVDQAPVEWKVELPPGLYLIASNGHRSSFEVLPDARRLEIHA